MATQVWISKNPKGKSGIVLVGLPGIGLVGKIVVDYLIKELKPAKIADITSDSFPPTVITKNGVLELIKDEIYHVHHKNEDFYFVAGPVQPNWEQGIGSTEQQYDFAQTLVAAFKQLNVTHIITLAGLNVGEQRMTMTPHVVVSATDAATLEAWKKSGAKSEQPEGMISGAAGMILGIGKTQRIPGACLMGETSARLVYGDPGASKAVLDLLVKKYGFKVKMDKIDSESKQIEKAFKKLADTMQAEGGDDSNSSKRMDLPYVR